MKVLIINGSFRKGSFNKALSEIGKKALLKEGIDVSSFPIETLPFVNQDLEKDLPSPIKESAKAVEEADVLWVFSPEYNHEMPAVLKNAFDWWSRQRVEGVPILKEKPLLVSGIGGGNATKSMQKALKELALFLGMKPLEPSFEGRLPVSVWQTGVYAPSETDIQGIEAQAKSLL